MAAGCQYIVLQTERRSIHTLCAALDEEDAIFDELLGNVCDFLERFGHVDRWAVED
jgi:hypothetical protein